MIPRNEGPSDEPRRRYLVQNQHSPTTHPTRNVHRRAQTPPPPASESWRSRPPRQVNSDTKIIQKTHRAKPEDTFYKNSPGKAEMYYIQQPHHENRFTTISSRVQEGDTRRRQRQLEPIERKHYVEQEPPVSKKVYKKLPDNRHQNPRNEHIPNGNNLRLVRKVEKIYPTPGTYQSTPHLANTYDRNNQNPSLYHLRSKDEYY
jgi:hypothetical protein